MKRFLGLFCCALLSLGSLSGPAGADRGRHDRDDDDDGRRDHCGCRGRDEHRHHRGHRPSPDDEVVVPIDERYCGRGYADWVEDWWQWAVSFPASDNPLFDHDSCRAGQRGPVVFLSGSFRGAPVRTCATTDEQAVLVPLFTVENDFPCPDKSWAPAPGQSLEEFLTDGAREVVDEMKSIGVAIDGVPLDDFRRYRVTTPLFHFKADPSLAQAFDACLTGRRQPVVSDGFWILLEPLSRGVHDLNIHGESQPLGLSYNFDWQITVTAAGHRWR